MFPVFPLIGEGGPFWPNAIDQAFFQDFQRGGITERLGMQAKLGPH
jgi:hypothetical protein